MKIDSQRQCCSLCAYNSKNKWQPINVAGDLKSICPKVIVRIRLVIVVSIDIESVSRVILQGLQGAVHHHTHRGKWKYRFSAMKNDYNLLLHQKLCMPKSISIFRRVNVQRAYFWWLWQQQRHNHYPCGLAYFIVGYRVDCFLRYA